jgi:hypothetical protein
MVAVTGGGTKRYRITRPTLRTMNQTMDITA